MISHDTGLKEDAVVIFTLNDYFICSTLDLNQFYLKDNFPVIVNMWNTMRSRFSKKRDQIEYPINKFIFQMDEIKRRYSLDPKKWFDHTERCLFTWPCRRAKFHSAIFTYLDCLWFMNFNFHPFLQRRIVASSTKWKTTNQLLLTWGLMRIFELVVGRSHRDTFAFEFIGVSQLSTLETTL